MAQLKLCLTAESPDILTTRTISGGSIWKEIAMENSFYTAEKRRLVGRLQGGVKCGRTGEGKGNKGRMWMIYLLVNLMSCLKIFLH